MISNLMISLGVSFGLAWAQPTAGILPSERIDLWTHRLLKTSKAWNSENFGAERTIGLIGTGIDLDHFQTINQMYTNFNEDPTNGIDDDGNGFIDDVHGWNFIENKNVVGKGNGKASEMAGVMVSNHCAGPIRGIAPLTQIIPLQALSDDTQDDAKIIAAMEYAVNAGAQMILFESAIQTESLALQSAFAKLAQKNIPVILPAGDGGRELVTTSLAPLQNVIVVGATNAQDHFAAFSNFGEGVDLAAPGENVWTTIDSENIDPFAAKSHTGLAAAHVAGALALLMAAEPDLTVVQMKQRMILGVDAGSFPVKANGRLNIAKLLKL